jgi:hypothetical protein
MQKLRPQGREGFSVFLKGLSMTCGKKGCGAKKTVKKKTTKKKAKK